MTIIYHLGIIYNFKFNRNETSRHTRLNPLDLRVDVRCGRKRPETPERLQAVQNVLASVVDIGAKTDYDASDPDVEINNGARDEEDDV